MKNKKLIWLVILSLIIGIIFSYPNLLGYFSFRSNPDLVFTPLNGGDENLYATKINQVANLQFNSLSSHLPWFGPIILGLFTKLTGSINFTLIISDFLLPIIIFLLIYKLTYLITKHYWGSILASVSAILISPLTTKIPPVTPALFNSFINTLTLKTPYFLKFSRLVPPQFSFIIFTLFLYYFYLTITQTKKITKYYFFSGLLSGLLAYTYFYEWSASIVILFLGLVFSKPKRLKLFKGLILAVIIATPCLYLSIFKPHVDKALMFGQINGRFIESLTTLRYGLISLFIFIAAKRNLKPFLLSLTLAPVILLNQQLITGFTINPGHWPDSVFEPLMLIIGFIFLSTTAKKYFPDNFKTALLLVPILSFSALNQLKITNQYINLYSLATTQDQLLKQLNHFPQSTILTLDKRLNRYLSVYTPHSLYLPYGSFSTLSIEELWNRVNLSSSIYQIDQDNYLTLLSNTQFIGQIFDLYYNYHQKSNLTNLSFPNDIKDRIQSSHPIFSLGSRYIPDNVKKAQLEAFKTTTISKVCEVDLNYVILGGVEKDLAAKIN
ncbi:hypothetical protein KKB06_05165, partial [Patescibacteria group bacterium]|nr:hypothetical protein [Patescibacteria group bacterium]